MHAQVIVVTLKAIEQLVAGTLDLRLQNHLILYQVVGPEIHEMNHPVGVLGPPIM